MAARLTTEATDAVPIWFVSPENWDEVRGAIGETSARFAAACGFEPKPGRLQLLPDASGGLAGALFGQAGANAGDRDPLAPGKLATALPAGDWRFANSPQDAELATLGFLLGLYRFDRFKVDASTQPRLAAPAGVDGEDVERVAAAVAFGRDLVNAPANILGPAALESAATELAQAFDASVETIRGVELLGKNLPLIHAVGAAAFEAPRLVDFVWGRADAPKVTLVGKGVVFDTGGLDIKPANGMELMKKDMGDAATALTLARLIMESALEVRLRSLIPISRIRFRRGLCAPATS